MWPGIQRTTRAARRTGSNVIPPVTALQPNMTGIPPLTPPRIMFSGCLLFRYRLYTYCHSFKSSPLEKNGELFGAIQHFINTRNLILHANISDAMEEHIIKQDTNLLVLKRKEEKEKYGIASDIMNLNNVNVIRANKLVQKFVAKVLQSLAEDVKIPFTMVHSNLWVEYRHEEPDSIFFPLSEDDYVPLKEIRSILKESTELDEDYYNISEKKF
ncbi:MAG: hypothetical protein O8C66_03300, partial [Candidatus Methanoperedens sp.]|nr:hypothetical protein [Candidatus Methanoperedens sp.]